MIDLSSSIELREFAQVEAVPGTALLRVSARVPRGAPHDPALTLVVEDPAGPKQLSRLPAPPDPEGVLRAAFSAPAGEVERASGFWLAFSDGSRLELPAPTASSRRVGRPGAQPERRRATDAAALLEQRWQREQGERAALKRQAAELSAQVAELTRELRARDAPQVDTAPFQARLARAVSELATVTAARVQAERAASELEVELRTAIAERDRAERTAAYLAEQLDRAAADARAVALSYEQEAAAREEAERNVVRLRQALVEARAELKRTRGELANASSPADARPLVAHAPAGASRPNAPAAAPHAAAAGGRLEQVYRLPSEVLLGFSLIVVGLVLAALILSGAVSLGSP